MGAIKRIVVAIDFSKPSHDALDYAIDLARELGAKMHVVYAVEPMEFSGVDVLGGAPIATQHSWTSISARHVPRWRS
jgi:nucleotide-binding universal stress UspA family protein